MCGIAGIVGVDRASIAQFDSDIQKSIEYRGRDERGSGLTTNVRFSSRLSIIDIEHGQQPMLDKTGIRSFLTGLLQLY